MTCMAVGPVHADRYWSHSCFTLLVQVPAGRHEEWAGLAVCDVAYATSRQKNVAYTTSKLYTALLLTRTAVGPVHADRYWSRLCFPLLVQVPAGRHEEWWEGLAVFDVAYATYICSMCHITAEKM